MTLLNKANGGVTDQNDLIGSPTLDDNNDVVELTKGLDLINAFGGVDAILATTYDYDVEFDMNTSVLKGIDEKGEGEDQSKLMFGFENYYASFFGAISERSHVITGNDSANLIIGGNNDDTFYLSAGGDTLNALAGIDTLNGSKLSGDSGITVNLGTTNDSGNQTINTGDTIAGFENVVGTNNNDSLLGNNEANLLDGGAGFDILYGYDGNDTLIKTVGGGTLAGMDGSNDVADIGDATLSQYYESPALLAFLGIPAGGFLRFTRADGSEVNVHESTEKITVNGTTRKWFEWYGDRPDAREAEPSYTLTPSSNAVDEGQSLTTTVETSNVAEGTELYWSASGDGIDASDFAPDNALNGSGSVGADGSFSFEHSLLNDLNTEGIENLSIKLFSDSSRSVEVANTVVQINDTSVSPDVIEPTYNLSLSANSLNEGDELTSTVTTTDVAPGSILYWELSGQGIDSDDFATGQQLSGSGTVALDGSFSFAHTLAEDLRSEGAEALTVSLYSDSNRSQLVDSNSVLVNDTSVDPDQAEGVDIFRFYNSSSGVHFYTPSEAEKDSVINTLPSYSYEGVAYQAPSEGGTQLYRFYNANKGYHFMTTSEEEALNVVRQSAGENYDLVTGLNVASQADGWGYQYEGRTFQVATEESDATPTEVYRFFHPDNGVHFYSASLDEVRNVITQSSGAEYANDLDAAMNAPLIEGGLGYQLEGVAWFVL